MTGHTRTTGPARNSTVADGSVSEISINLVDAAKNLATCLGTASVLGYLAGYLAMRARAAALGTDPVFALVDEVYVFAGFRFLFVTLLLLLIITPVVLLVRWAAFSSRANWSAAPGILDWVIIGGLLIAVLWILSRTMSVDGVLFVPKEDYTAWERAALGLSPGRSLGLTLFTLTLFSLTIAWLLARWQAELVPFDWLLMLLLAVQSFLLPIQHGTYFADRNVRVLDAIPAVVSGLVPPVAVVGGTSDYATLLGQTAGGEPVLTTVKRGELNGIAVRRKTTLKLFAAELSEAEAPATPTRSGEMQMSTEDEGQVSIFTTLMEQINLTLEKIGSLGDSGVEEGQLWVVDLQDDGTAQSPRRVGTASNLAWPVAGGSRLFATQHGQLVEMTSGEPEPWGDTDVFWHKLVGALADGTVIGIVVDDEGAPQRAVLGADGALTIESHSEVGVREIAFLMQESRSYTEGRELNVVRPQSRQGFDVVFKSELGARNVSECRGDACGHPSLSSDGKLIAYILQPRY